MSTPANNDSSASRRVLAMPDTYLILAGVALLAFLLTYLLPAGRFDMSEQTQADGSVRKILVADSFTIANPEPKGMPVFAAGGDMGLLNAVFEGMVAGSKWGSSIGVFAFILIAGGAFGIIMATGAIDRGLKRLISRSQRSELLFLPVLFIMFSLGGAVFGMGEEVIPFVLIVAPVLVAMGYDSITALLVTYVATQIGFGCSWMNPFSVSVAQGIAGVPLMSGAGFRIAMWCIFTALGLAFTLYYAQRIRRNPTLSLVYSSDRHHHQTSLSDNNTALGIGDALIFLILFAGLGWMIWGVTFQQYYLPEIATQFFTMGLAAGVVGCIFKLQNMTGNSAAEAFKQGASQLLPAALVVAFAKSIVLLLGGDNAAEPSVLNTILHHASGWIGGWPDLLSAWFMLIFQSIFNFFVTSGSGQAALTMPLMAPLGDLVGVTRQTAVLCFQLGDGLTNIIVPTSAALMGCLGAARVDWVVWIRFILPLQFLLFIASTITVITAVLIGF